MVRSLFPAQEAHFQVRAGFLFHLKRRETRGCLARWPVASRTYVPCSLLELMGDLGAKGVLDQDLRSSNEPSWVRAQTSGKERPPPLAFPFVAPAGGRVQVRPQHKLHPTTRAASRWEGVRGGLSPRGRLGLSQDPSPGEAQGCQCVSFIAFSCGHTSV